MNGGGDPSRLPEACPLCGSWDYRRLSGYKSPQGRFLDADSIVQCKDEGCGLVFASPMPSEREIDRFYKDGLYHDEYTSGNQGADPFFFRLAQSRVVLIDKHLASDSLEKCLDVGGGYAIFGRALKKRRPEVEYHIVEPAADCRRSWGGWVNKSFANLSEVTESGYGLVALNQVLEHVGRPLDFLRNVAEKMALDGKLFIEVPYRDDLYKPSVAAHLVFWEPRTLRLAVEEVGMRVEFCDSVGMHREVAERYFNNRSSLLEKAANPWTWMGLADRIISGMNPSWRLDFSGRFKINDYGGNRQWIRCVAGKTE